MCDECAGPLDLRQSANWVWGGLGLAGLDFFISLLFHLVVWLFVKRRGL